MAIKQALSKRYIDKEKLGKFWRTHPDFKGQPCLLEVSSIVTQTYSLNEEG